MPSQQKLKTSAKLTRKRRVKLFGSGSRLKRLKSKLSKSRKRSSKTSDRHAFQQCKRKKSDSLQVKSVKKLKTKKSKLEINRSSRSHDKYTPQRPQTHNNLKSDTKAEPALTTRPEIYHWLGFEWHTTRKKQHDTVWIFDPPYYATIPRNQWMQLPHTLWFFKRLYKSDSTVVVPNVRKLYRPPMRTQKQKSSLWTAKYNDLYIGHNFVRTQLNKFLVNRHKYPRNDRGVFIVCGHTGTGKTVLMNDLQGYDTKTFYPSDFRCRETVKTRFIPALYSFGLKKKNVVVVIDGLEGMDVGELHIIREQMKKIYGLSGQLRTPSNPMIILSDPRFNFYQLPPCKRFTLRPPPVLKILIRVLTQEKVAFDMNSLHLWIQGFGPNPSVGFLINQLQFYHSIRNKRAEMDIFPINLNRALQSMALSESKATVADTELKYVTYNAALVDKLHDNHPYDNADIDNLADISQNLSYIDVMEGRSFSQSGYVTSEYQTIIAARLHDCFHNNFTVKRRATKRPVYNKVLNGRIQEAALIKGWHKADVLSLLYTFAPLYQDSINCTNSTIMGLFNRYMGDEICNMTSIELQGLNQIKERAMFSTISKHVL